MSFGEDANGIYKDLPDGRCLRIDQRMYNTLLTLSNSRNAMTWEHGW